MFEALRVVVLGGGDLASGVVYRLHRSGFRLLVTELARPLVIRRAVAFASAVFEGEVEVEGVRARKIEALSDCTDCWAAGTIPVIVDERGSAVRASKPAIVVDARMAKRNLGTTLADAPLVIALGPGYYAGRDCHAVIETQRGHWLGRVIWEGSAAPDTGTPGTVLGHTTTRVLRSPADGFVRAHRAIGDAVAADELIAEVAGIEVRAPFAGVLRGMIHPEVRVWAGLKIGDLDPRGIREHCFTISEKALAIAGGVLEAILSAPQFHDILSGRASS